MSLTFSQVLAGVGRGLGAVEGKARWQGRGRGDGAKGGKPGVPHSQPIFCRFKLSGGDRQTEMLNKKEGGWVCQKGYCKGSSEYSS